MLDLSIRAVDQELQEVSIAWKIWLEFNLLADYPPLLVYWQTIAITDSRFNVLACVASLLAWLTKALNKLLLTLNEA